MQVHAAMLSSLGAFDCKWGDGRLTLTAPSKTAAVSAVAPLDPSSLRVRLRCWKQNQSNGLCPAAPGGLREERGREGECGAIGWDDGTVAHRRSRRITSLWSIHAREGRREASISGAFRIEFLSQKEERSWFKGAQQGIFRKGFSE